MDNIWGYDESLDLEDDYQDENDFEEDDDCCRDNEISSDEEKLDESSLSQFLECLQNNPLDGDLTNDLVDLLERHLFYHLAYQVAKIGLEYNPKHLELNESLTRLPSKNNLALKYKIKNLWFTPQKYFYDDHLQVRKILDGRTDPSLASSQVDLGEIEANPNLIPSLGDTIMMIPTGDKNGFEIFRKFVVQPFTMYQLKLRFMGTKNLDLSLGVWTNERVPRLKYKLNGSQIQYNFNSLNQSEIHIGLTGKNNNDDPGQLRISDFSLTQMEIKGIQENLVNRHLSPTLPIIANLLIGPEDEEGEQDTYQGIRETLESLVDQVDRINIYLSKVKNPRVYYDLLKNSKYVVSSGSNGRLGLLNRTEETIGYHFMVGVGIVYHSDYVALLLSKLRQYQNRVVVGLKGIQINASYQSWSKSNKTISAIMATNQDIKSHLLGFESFAFLSGVLGAVESFKKNLSDSEIQEVTGNDRLVPILLGLNGQKLKIPFICVERVEKMIKYQHRSESRMKDSIEEFGDKLVKIGLPWKFF